jgi:hypothetical protein
MAKFPKAGDVEPKAMDPMMKRVDLDNGEIGSRNSGMPKNVGEGNKMQISHVGGTGMQKG